MAARVRVVVPRPSAGAGQQLHLKQQQEYEQQLQQSRDADLAASALPSPVRALLGLASRDGQYASTGKPAADSFLLAAPAGLGRGSAAAAAAAAAAAVQGPRQGVKRPLTEVSGVVARQQGAPAGPQQQQQQRWIAQPGLMDHLKRAATPLTPLTGGHMRPTHVVASGATVAPARSGTLRLSLLPNDYSVPAYARSVLRYEFR